jgi:hypothetical protein
MREKQITFICNICGLRAPEPVLCVKQGCPTPMLVYGEAYKPIVLSRAN